MKDRLRIAVWHNLCSGGGKRAMYHHVQGLVSRGHTVEAWCPPAADMTYLPLNGIIREHVIPLAMQERNLSNRLTALLHPYQRVADKMQAMENHVKLCAEEMHHGGFDLLLANPCIFFSAGQIGRHVTIPKVLYLQEPNRKLYESEPVFPWLAMPASDKPWWAVENIKAALNDFVAIKGMRLQAREEYENARAYDMILVNSFFSRESVFRAYGLESKVCYLGVDCELFHTLNLPRENYVVGLGTMTRGKRPDRAVRAIGSIPSDKRPDLVWIGNFSDDSFKFEVMSLAESLGVNLDVRIRLTDTELVESLNKASAMIYTSQLEPFGFAPLEANACGTPVVAIAEGGVRETLQEGINGFLIDDDNPVALGEAVLRLLQDSELARKMGERARAEIVEKWTWEKALDRLEEKLFDLVDKSGRSSGIVVKSAGEAVNLSRQVEFSPELPAIIAGRDFVARGKAYVDNLNGKPLAAINIMEKAKLDSLSLDGWAVDDDSRTVPPKVMVELKATAGDCVYYAAATRMSPVRPDIAENFKVPSFITAGFCLKAGIRLIPPGQYAINVIMQSRGDALRVETMSIMVLK